MYFLYTSEFEQYIGIESLLQVYYETWKQII